MRYIRGWGAALALLTATLGALQVDAQAPLSSLVHLICTGSDGAKSAGTGVFVSEAGHILTAKHVVFLPGEDEPGECKAAIGTVSSSVDRVVYFRMDSRRYDAALLQILPFDGEVITPLEIARLTSDMQGMPVKAWGYPSGGVGQPTVRPGHLSTTFPNGRGMLETSADTAEGMSGGPVLLDDGRLVAIVASARFSRKGTVSAREVLSAEIALPELMLFWDRPGAEKRQILEQPEVATSPIAATPAVTATAAAPTRYPSSCPRIFRFQAEDGAFGNYSDFQVSCTRGQCSQNFGLKWDSDVKATTYRLSYASADVTLSGIEIENGSHPFVDVTCQSGACISLETAQGAQRANGTVENSYLFFPNTECASSFIEISN